LTDSSGLSDRRTAVESPVDDARRVPLGSDDFLPGRGGHRKRSPRIGILLTLHLWLPRAFCVPQRDCAHQEDFLRVAATVISRLQYDARMRIPPGSLGTGVATASGAWTSMSRASVHNYMRKQMKNVLVAAMVAIAAIYSSGCSVATGQRSMGDVVDDSTITSRVKSRFVEDKLVAANRINVETLKGVVQLSGFAISEAERQKAAQIAAAVPGVKQVQNAIAVKPAS
jgi:osmotically-inducible protein OsmY